MPRAIVRAIQNTRRETLLCQLPCISASGGLLSCRADRIQGDDQKAQHFNKRFFEDYDHILVMDKNNLKDVLALAETDEYKQKVRLFLLNDKELVDPYYDNNLFEPVCKEVEQRCKEILKELHS
ncbi:MAG: hypothetical protein EOO07_34365 [Chitinophagaceae bacterium]|nr:MAG: hypothetical protein EOO07_34365 [Chitinophagaceae bacterium]